jgi:arylsulfatase
LAKAKVTLKKNAPSPPGKSLVPAFAEDRPIERDYLWWSHDGNRAIRVKDWKLVSTNDKVWELFDLAKDRTETVDLSAKHPDKVKELEKLWLDKQDEFIEDATKSRNPKKKK